MEQQKEMNLFDLCAAIGRGIGQGMKWVIKLFGRMIRLTYRQWWVILIVILLATAAALYYSRKENRMYKVNAVAVLNGATKDVVAREYLALNQANSQFEYQNLQHVLGLSPEIAASISNFETFDVIDILGDSTIDVIDYEQDISITDTLYVRLPHMVALRYRTKLPDATPQVQEAILNYLNTREYIRSPHTQFHANLERASLFHHEQLEKLDSLTTEFYFANNQMPQIGTSMWQSGFMLGAREINLFLEDIWMEIDQLQPTDMRLALAGAPVVLQSPFVVEAKAVNGIIKCLAIALILGWLLGLVFAALVENRKEILRWLKQK